MQLVTISTQTLDEAARHLATTLLDTVSLYTVGLPVTTGSAVTLPLTLAAANLRGLVQSTVLQNATENISVSVFSIKLPRATPFTVGMVVEVISCLAEPSLVGKKLRVDKVSLNGLAMLRKGTASEFDVVNPQGKEVL